MKKTIVLACLLSLCAACAASDLESEKTDFTGPYINMTQYDFSTVVGEPIDFSTISGYDDVDGLLPVKVEGYVNYYKVGEYYPSITCTDLSGNKTEQVITVRVLHKEDMPEAVDHTDVPDVREEEEGCTLEGSDPDLPCSVVPPQNTEKYATIFSGSSSLEACELRCREGSEDSCEEIFANDGTLWGYGYLKN